MSNSLRSIAHALGGDIAGRNRILCPGPGHSRRDRSLSVTFNGDDFLCHSFAGNDWRECRDHIKVALGWTDAPRHANDNAAAPVIHLRAPDLDDDADLSHRVPEIVTPFERRLTIRDLCTVARTASNSVEWVKETGFTNSARPVTEGQTKPESDLAFNLLTAPVRVIAHTFKVSRQMLDDAPALAAYIGARGTYGLKYQEEQQILTGNGTGQNLNGIVPQATAFVPPFTSVAEQAFDRINAALAQVETANAVADGIVLNSTDWRQMLGIKDGDERYLASQSPFGIQAPRLWGIPVVPSQSMQAGEFLVGQFAGNCFIFDRLDTEVLLSTEDGDNFVKNMATVRIESRLTFVVTRPEALVTGDLSAST
jgi:HK97 family phage major capsid protein